MPPNYMYLCGETGKILWYEYFTTIKKKGDVLNGVISNLRLMNVKWIQGSETGHSAHPPDFMKDSRRKGLHLPAFPAQTF